jgi:hypothetical protein
MGNQPVTIGRIPGKAKAYVIIYPPLVHGLQGLFHHLESLGFPFQLVITQEKQQVMGSGKLRLAAKSTIYPVEFGGKLGISLIQYIV